MSKANPTKANALREQGECGEASAISETNHKPNSGDCISQTENISCPRWGMCIAPICPLDSQWSRRTLASDDPICFYLTESVKEGAEAIFKGRGRGNLFAVMCGHVSPMSGRWSRIRRALERAKKSGSRMARLSPREATCLASF